MNRHPGFVLVLLSLSSATAFAQQAREPELSTDRPGFTEPSRIVSRGYLQYEVGLTYEHAGDASTVSVPETLVRVGVSRRIELRFATDGLISEGAGGARTSGAADVELGAKVKLLDQERAGLDVAVLPILSLPTGSEAFSSGAVDPTVKFSWERTLPAGFALGGNYNVASVSDGAGRFTQQALSVSLGHEVPAGFSGYVEVYGLTPMDRNGDAGWMIDLGVSRLVGTRMQWDIEGGRGMTAAASDWFIGFGFAIRTRTSR